MKTPIRYQVLVTLSKQEVDKYSGKPIETQKTIDTAQSNITYSEAEAKALFYTVASEVVRAIQE